MEKKRSKGITICTSIMTLYSFILLYLAIMALLIFRGILPPADMWKSIKGIVCGSFFVIYLTSFQWLPILTLITGIIYLICGVGIIRLKLWGRKVAIYLSTLLLFLVPCISIMLFANSIARGWEGFVYPIVLGYLIFNPFTLPALFFLIYLTRPKVKEQFK